MNVLSNFFRTLFRKSRPQSPSILYPSGKTSDEHLLTKYEVELIPPDYLNVSIPSIANISGRICKGGSTHRVPINQTISFGDFHMVNIGGSLSGEMFNERAQATIRSLFTLGFDEIVFLPGKVEVKAHPIHRPVSYPYIRDVVKKMLRLSKFMAEYRA